MGTIIKWGMAALIVHGALRASEAYWTYYAFRDAVQATAQFAGAMSEHDVHALVMEIAADMDIPVQPEQVTVRKGGNHTIVEASYVDRIEILPTYFRPWGFEVNVDALTVVIPKAQDLTPAQ